MIQTEVPVSAIQRVQVSSGNNAAVNILLV